MIESDAELVGTAVPPVLPKPVLPEPQPLDDPVAPPGKVEFGSG